jgi:hypothetical protein
MKANWFGHTLCRNCLLKHEIGEEIKGKVRRRKRRKQLLIDLKETTGYRKVKEKELDRFFWRTRSARCYRPVVRETKINFLKIYL